MARIIPTGENTGINRGTQNKLDATQREGTEGREGRVGESGGRIPSAPNVWTTSESDSETKEKDVVVCELAGVSDSSEKSEMVSGRRSQTGGMRRGEKSFSEMLTRVMNAPTRLEA